MHLKFLAFSLLIIGPRTVNAIGQECIIEEFGVCLPKSYDKRIIPERPFDVNVDIGIAQITKVDDDLSTVDFLAKFFFGWKESRLIDTNKSLNNSKTQVYWPLNEEWLDKLWLPDVHIIGSQDIKLGHQFIQQKIGKCIEKVDSSYPLF